jgi:UDP-N-acetylmuramate dehydrogenase
VREALHVARERALPVAILGGGSNVLVPDAGLDALVLHVAIAGVTWRADGAAVEVTAGAGVPWDALVAESVARGLAGIECLSGVPGTVGGTPIQNVGAYGQEVAQAITSVACLDRRSLELVHIPGADCRFAYRQSRFKREDAGRYVVTAVTFRLRTNARPVVRYPELAKAVAARGDLASLTPGEGLRLVRDTVLDLRRGKGMVVDQQDPDSRSVGSFFTNPVLTAEAFQRLQGDWSARGGGRVPSFPAPDGVKVPAAWLVEHAGFAKGHRRGGAMVSRKHALALVNAGGTTVELLELADAIVHAVEARFGLRLEREPVELQP